MKIRLLIIAIYGIEYLVAGQPNLNVRLNTQVNAGTYEALNKVSLEAGFKFSGSGFKAQISSPGFTPDNNTFYAPVGGLPLINTDKYIAGSISGTFSVTPQGMANYVLPLEIPQGIGNLTPNLSIVYNSTLTDGLLGTGFSLGGLSVISRAPSNYIDDGKVDRVNFDNNDRLVLDGNRLVLYRGTYGSDGASYLPLNFDGSLIIAHGGLNSQTSWFEVKTKSGLTMEYGHTQDSRITVPKGKIVTMWLLSKVSDATGNYYTINYERDTTTSDYWVKEITINARENEKFQYYVVFNYTNRQNADRYYINGYPTQLSKYLTEIAIYKKDKNSNGHIRSYVLTYQPACLGTRLQLTSITQKVGNVMLNPIIFKWKDEDYDIRPTTVGTYTVQGSQILTGDFNGDGRSDILSISYDNKSLYIYLNNGNSGFATTPIIKNFTQSMNFFTGDFNGDGRTDVLAYRQSDKTIHVALTNIDGSLGNFQLKGSIASIQLPKLFVFDNNGDGLSDVIAVDIAVNTSGYNNFQLLYAQFVNNNLTFYDKGSTQYSSLIKGYPIATGDFDGDGMMDLVTNDKDIMRIFMSDKSYGLFKTFTANIDPNFAVFADFNGDGCTDIFNGLFLYYANGKKAQTFNDLFIQQATSEYEDGIYSNTQVGDINGDGKADIMNGYMTIGFGKFAKLTTNYDEFKNNLTCDINGDGVPEILSYSSYSSNLTEIDITSYFSTSRRGQLIEGIRDGMGVVTKIEYRDLADPAVYTRQSNASYPVTDLSAGIQVVYRVTTEDGIGGSRVTTYQYEGGKVHRLGRGLLGFNKVRATDSKTNITTETTYEYDTTNYFTAIKSQITKTQEGSTLSTTTYTNTLKALVNGKVYNFVPSTIESATYDLSGNKTGENRTSFTYDNYGNTIIVNSTTGYPGGTTTTYTIENNNSNDNWWIGKVMKKTVKYSRYMMPDITRSWSYSYDNDRRLLISETSEPDDPQKKIVKEYTYNNRGQIINEKVSGANKTLITQYVYNDSVNPEWPYKIINPVEWIDSMSYHPKFGKVTTQWSSDSTKTILEYDEFGRLSKKTTPFGSTWYSYRWASAYDSLAPSTAVFVIRTLTQPSIFQYEFYDKYGRKVRQVTQDINGNYIYIDTEYDDLGRVKRQSEPYRKNTTPLWTTYEYNLLGQVTRTTYPDGSTSTVSYNGLNITTTNPKGQTEKRTYDLRGFLISVTDHAGGVVQYTYDAMGNMLTVTDPAGNVTSMSYDIYGNRTTLTDKDLGTTSDVYNALGQLVSSTNAKGFTTSYTYDNLGRVTTRTETDAQTNTSVVTNYTYDGQYYCTRGKIIQESNNVHTKKYAYNSKGLLVKISETIDNATYNTQFTYDSYGRVIGITYPGGFKVKQSYRSGYLYQVTSNGGDTLYYTCNDMTPRGQVSSYQLGANLTVTHTFDANTGFLKQTVAGNIQDMRYEYDALGNLTRRTNQKRGLSESFTYDGLNRLTSSTVYVNNIATQVVRLQYNAIGNITFKSDVGTYQYEATRPHAVARIVNPQEDYQPYDYNVEYTSFDKVYSISNATQNVTFTYGTDYQRIKAVSVKEGQTTTKYYVGQLYEKEVLPGGEVKENFYIFANGEAVAIYTRSTKAQNTRLAYCLRDHLGSLMYLVSPTGTVLEEYAYDPWGRRRDPVTWKPFTGTAATARGFTGHEHIDLFELVNMNGRVYDPRLGRFLSPDPYVQDPTNSQNLNRYSYCLNNPLKYTDPSGKLFKEIFGTLGAVINILPFVVDVFLDGPIRAWKNYKSDVRSWWDAGKSIDN
ncbi:MAG: FG-GAP-like repeat-containing protein, partial [Bacteroidales bacterium]